jgi:hypothetical protein
VQAGETIAKRIDMANNPAATASVSINASRGKVWKALTEMLEALRTEVESTP